MTWLLHTHTLLWALTGDERLSPRAREILADGEQPIHVSAASAWEISVKVARGRLTLSFPPERLLEIVTGPFRLIPLPVGFDHALAAGSLPPIHRDPFDRLLVAQARAIGATIVTGDPEIARYGVPTAW